MRFLPAWMIVVAVLLGVGRARAEVPSAAAPLAMDEPKSGLHLEVAEGCQVRPEDGGGAACRDFAASAHKSEAFAVVLGTNGLFFYSVAIFTEVELGVGEARARRVSASIGETVTGTPEPVTYGEQRFLRSRLLTATGAAICFITVDDRPEVSIIMFASEPESLAGMEPKAEAAMRTLRRTKAAAAAPTTPMSCGTQALVSVFLVFVFGLPVFAFIFRAIRIAQRFQKKDVHLDEPRGPRRTGPQLAGEKCAACKKNIVVALDAVACPRCEAAVHRENCLARHQAKEHAADS